jgi:hypothetical protein
MRAVGVEPDPSGVGVSGSATPRWLSWIAWLC